MKRTILIVAIVLALGVAVYLLFLRKRVAVAGANNGTMMAPATVLPPITPPPGSPGFSWTDTHAAAIGATAQGTCMAYGGGQICDSVGKVGTVVGKVYSQGIQKAGSAALNTVKKLKFW